MRKENRAYKIRDPKILGCQEVAQAIVDKANEKLSLGIENFTSTVFGLPIISFGYPEYEDQYYKWQYCEDSIHSTINVNINNNIELKLIFFIYRRDNMVQVEYKIKCSRHSIYTYPIKKDYRVSYNDKIYGINYNDGIIEFNTRYSHRKNFMGMVYLTLLECLLIKKQGFEPKNNLSTWIDCVESFYLSEKQVIKLLRSLSGILNSPEIHGRGKEVQF